MSPSLPLVLAVVAPASAAPTSDAPGPVAAQASPPAEHGADASARARQLSAQAQARFELAEYDQAIELWNEAYEAAPLGMRGQLYVPLANAHLAAYESDGDRQHLLTARAMFAAHLEALDPTNEEARAVTQSELAKVEALLEHSEAKRAHPEGQAAPPPPMPIEREPAPSMHSSSPDSLRTTHDRRRVRLFGGIGGSAAGLGLASLGIMTVGLALGADVERRGHRAAAGLNPTPEGLQSLVDEGERYNRMAWATGVLGGVLLVSGSTLVGMAIVHRRRARPHRSARITTSLTGLEVWF